MITINKIARGTIVYRPNLCMNSVERWEIVDIWVDSYVTDFKTICKIRYPLADGYATKEVYLSDILHCYDSEREAREYINQFKEKNNL